MSKGNNEPSLIKGNAKKEDSSTKTRDRETLYIDGKPTKGNKTKKKRSSCLTCLVSFCCVLVLVIGGIFGAGAILYAEYVQPIIGLNLSEAFGVIKGIYTPDREKIITNPYDEVEDNKAFYSNLKSALCVSQDFDISITDIMNELLTSEKLASARETSSSNMTTGNEYFDSLLQNISFDFSSLENYDGKAKYFSVTDKQLASVLQEALLVASNIEQLKPIEAQLGSRLSDIARVEQLIFADSATTPKITVTLGLDVKKAIKGVLETEQFASLPSIAKTLLPAVLPKELLVGLTFFPDATEGTVIHPIVSINTTKDDVLQKLMTSIDSYFASIGNDKIFEPLFNTVATSINSTLHQVTSYIGIDSLIFDGATSSLKLDSVGAVLVAMGIQNVSSSDFFSMISVLNDIDFMSKSDEALQEYLQSVIPHPPTEADVDKDIANIGNAYGINTSEWNADNILEHFDESILDTVDLANLEYLTPDEMKRNAKLSAKSLAVIANKYLAGIKDGTIIIADSSTSTLLDTLSKLDINVADINIGKSSSTRDNNLYLDFSLSINAEQYVKDLIGDNIFSNIVMSIVPKHLYISARVLLSTPTASDKISLAINFNQSGTTKMLDTLAGIMAKLAPDSANIFDIGKLTQSIEDMIYPIINGEKNKDGKYAVPIKPTFSEGFIDLPSLYELVCMISQAMNNGDNAELFLETPSSEDVYLVYNTLKSITNYRDSFGDNLDDAGNITSIPMDSVDLYADNGLVKREFERHLFMQEGLINDNGTPLLDQLTAVLSNISDLSQINTVINFNALKMNTSTPTDMNLTISAGELVKMLDSYIATYADTIQQYLPYNSISAYDGEFYLDANNKPYLKMKLYAYDLADKFPASFGLGDLTISPKQILPKLIMLTADVEMEPESATAPSIMTFGDLFKQFNAEATENTSNRKVMISINSCDQQLLSSLLAMFVKDGSFSMDSLTSQLALAIDTAFSSLEQQNIALDVMPNPNASDKDKYVLQSTNIYSIINKTIFADATPPANADINLQQTIYQLNDTANAKLNAGASNIADDYKKINNSLSSNYYLKITDDTKNPIDTLSAMGEADAKNIFDLTALKAGDPARDASEYTAKFASSELALMLDEMVKKPVSEGGIDISSFLSIGMFNVIEVHSLQLFDNNSFCMILKGTNDTTLPPTADSGSTDITQLTNLLLPSEMYIAITAKLTGATIDVQPSLVMNTTTKESLDYLMSIINIGKLPTDAGYVDIDKSLESISKLIDDKFASLTTLGLTYKIEEDSMLLESFYGLLYKLTMNVPDDEKKTPATAVNMNKIKDSFAQMQDTYASVGVSNIANDMDTINTQLRDNFGINGSLTTSSKFDSFSTLFALDKIDMKTFASKTGIGNGFGLPQNDYGNIVLSDTYDRLRISEGELARLLNNSIDSITNIAFITSATIHSVQIYSDSISNAPTMSVVLEIVPNLPSSSEDSLLNAFLQDFLSDKLYLSLDLDLRNAEYQAGVDNLTLNPQLDNPEFKDHTDFIFEIINKNQPADAAVTKRSMIDSTKSAFLTQISGTDINITFEDDNLATEILYGTIYKLVKNDSINEATALTFKKSLYSLYHYNKALNSDIANEGFKNINTLLRDNYFINYANDDEVKSKNPQDVLSDFSNAFKFDVNMTNTNNYKNDTKLAVNNIDLANLIKSHLAKTPITIAYFNGIEIYDASITSQGIINIIFALTKDPNYTATGAETAFYPLIPDNIYVKASLDMSSDTTTTDKITIYAVDTDADGAISTMLNDLLAINMDILSTVKDGLNTAFDSIGKSVVYSDNTITFSSFYEFLATQLPNSSSIDTQTLKNMLFYLNETARTDDKQLTTSTMTYGYPDTAPAEHTVTQGGTFPALELSVGIHDNVLLNQINSNITTGLNRILNLKFVAQGSVGTVLNYVYKDYMAEEIDTLHYYERQTILLTTTISTSGNLGNDSLLSQVVPNDIFFTLLLMENSQYTFIINDMPFACQNLFNTLTNNALDTVINDTVKAITDSLAVTIDVNIMGNNVSKTFTYADLMKGIFTNNNTSGKEFNSSNIKVSAL